MRTPSLTSAGSSAFPFSTTDRTVRVIASMKDEAPAVAVNRTVVFDPKTSGPRVRSRSTS